MVVVGLKFRERVLVLMRLILLSLHLLLASTGALADGRTTEKPEDWERRLEMLRAVPYIGLSETAVDERQAGVVFYEPAKAYDGYNLYCTHSSGEVFLLDMKGQVIHKWTYSPQRKSFHAGHAVMLENGDILVLKEFLQLLRLNWNSKLVWKRTLAVHHDVAPAPDGSLYVIVRSLKKHRGLRVIFPAIVHLTANGKEIDRWSSYDHITDIMNHLDTRSFLDTYLDSSLYSRPQKIGISERVKVARSRPGYYYDYFHMNTIIVLPSTLLGTEDPRFQQGNLLVCLRNVNQIAVLEKDSYRILWAWGEAELEWPHHPTMLKNGHILIFDNGVKRGYSRVLELDPLTEAIVWEYVAESPEDFYSKFRGSAQRLPNGNTLICESERARVFEVTEEGKVVWMWLNPATQGGERQWHKLNSTTQQSRSIKHRESVYRMLRLPAAKVDRLLYGLWWWEWAFGREYKDS